MSELPDKPIVFRVRPQTRKPEHRPEFQLRVIEQPDETRWAAALSLLIEAGKAAELEKAALKPAV